MKLIVGLGNPGQDYKSTRHNIGFMVLEYLAEELDTEFKMSRRFKAFTSEARVGGERCILAMPHTFMNLSGHSVRSLVNWLKIDLKDMMVVLDEIDLSFADIRIKPKGRDAGHKGLRSIIECLGTNLFTRMRIGIHSRPGVKASSGYVLGEFTKREKQVLPDILRRASDACILWAKQGVEAAMNKYN